MKFAKLEQKLYQVFRVDRSQNKITIIYRYPQVVQPLVIRYEVVLISDDDTEIIFAIINFYPCLSDTELYLNIQPIEDTKNINNWDLGMTMQVAKGTDYLLQPVQYR